MDHRKPRLLAVFVLWSAAATAQTSYAQTYNFYGIATYNDTVFGNGGGGLISQTSGTAYTTFSLDIFEASGTQGFGSVTLLGSYYQGYITFYSPTAYDASGSMLSQGPRNNDEIYFGILGDIAEASIIALDQTDDGDEIEYLNVNFNTVPEPSSGLIALSGLLAVSFFVWARRHTGRPSAPVPVPLEARSINHVTS